MAGNDVMLQVFEPDGGVPNSELPLVFWRGRLPGSTRSGSAATALYRKNGWQGTWVYTVYPFWHFHTRGHEVLACVSGSARIGFGGDQGIKIDVVIGDVCVIPAGVGHRKFDASSDFQMAGGYPPGQQGNIVRPGEMQDDRIAREIAALALPETDPISGTPDGVVEIWREASSFS
ncbi:hypothetical protein SAZ10_02985 [Mesorhizobium sp. BAC0120]|uniref:hypothetical protein n=1 Tax=Mesorhizobium sp. BAC0120 TaxID=3090670 RepID=UPI00298CE96B|nr:hypothetical protein [Mesorhizobium sp. BAC0120]MDW6020721.1 hypothetical protein [Mesorhizobium sp. BAC0120]